MINYNSFNNAKPVDQRTPFIGAGEHVLAVVKYEEFASTQHGTALGATFMVLESSVHKPGTFVFQGWYPNKRASYPGDTGEIDRAADFVHHLLQKPLDQSGNAIAYLVQNAAAQPARGIIIKAKGVDKPAKLKRDGQMGKPFTEMTWAHVEGQTGESIAKVRASVDAHENAAKPPAAAPMPVTAGAGAAAAVQMPAPVQTTMPPAVVVQTPTAPAAPTAGAPSLLSQFGIKS